MNTFKINLPRLNTVKYCSLPIGHAFQMPNLVDVVYIKVGLHWMGNNLVNCIEIKPSDDFVDTYRPTKWNDNHARVVDCGLVESVSIDIKLKG